MISFADNVLMDKKKKTGKKDRHAKPGFQMRLHPMLRQQLDKLAEQNATNLSDVVRSAIREYLVKHAMWPPKD